MNETGCDRAMTFEEECGALRTEIGNLGKNVLGLKSHDTFKGEEARGGQHGEMKANIMLAYRHLEDARIRIGKILQAAGDGVSILDK